ncbi:MAG: hypothetical protein ABWZ98_15620 [Nakamurella sp.]
MTRTATWIALSMMWPLGLLLVVANMEIAEVTMPVFVILDAAYVAGSSWLLQRVRAGRAGRVDPETTRIATILVLNGVGLFAVVGFTGIPSAGEPDLLMLNTAALLGTAVVLLVAATSLLWMHRDSPRVTSVVPTVVVFVVGSTLYVANLLARVAVVLSGAAQQQAAVEDTAWVAHEYLRGLYPAPDFMGYLLVWMDLLQLAYVVSAFLAVAAVARLLGGRAIAGGAGRVLRIAGNILAAVIVIGVALAVVLPRDFDAVPAWAAFVASIPFMTTLLPFVLGLAMLHSSARRFTSHPPTESPAVPQIPELVGTNPTPFPSPTDKGPTR